nr:hypothetical protein [Tanacetum cinerariifolium]
EESVNATLEAEVLTRSSHSSRTSYAIAADLSEMELKKILIEKMEGNKSIKHSDEQRNLYKALVEAYEADKAILDTYGDSTILKRRREDDDQEGPSAGPNRGSKRQKEGALPAAQGDAQSWISDLAKQANACLSCNELLDTPIDFSNFIMHRLNNKDKKNRLMRIDELHKFSDGTLNDVRNALDDRLEGIRMQYLSSTIWRKGDKDRAAAMI